MNAFSAFLAMFTRGFGAMTKVCIALENVADAGVSLSIVAKETAGEYEDKSRADRAKAARALAAAEGIELLEAPKPKAKAA